MVILYLYLSLELVTLNHVQPNSFNHQKHEGSITPKIDPCAGSMFIEWIRDQRRAQEPLVMNCIRAEIPQK